MSEIPNEGHFALWVLQQQQLAMMLLGKIANPVTGEVDRSLDAARWHIDLLAVMEDRTRGNLDADEARLLRSVLTTLRLNFVEEAGKPDPGTTEKAAPGEGDGSAGSGSPEASAPEGGSA
jgi:hypothetical protein